MHKHTQHTLVHTCTLTGTHVHNCTYPHCMLAHQHMHTVTHNAAGTHTLTQTFAQSFKLRELVGPGASGRDGDTVVRE